MKFVVSGANGFVGSNFLSALQSSSHEVLGLIRIAGDRPAANTATTDYSHESLIEILKKYNPDVFIHAAGSASVGKSIAQPAVDHADSAGLVTMILSTLRTLKTPPKFLYVSSAAVYGNPVRLPVDENDPLKPISPYGNHRLESESLVRNYTHDTGASSVIARAFSLFGPAQRQLVLWEVAKQALTSESISFQGTGLELRDFLDVQEFVRRSLLVLECAPKGNSIVNVAAGNSITIKDLATQISQILEIQIPITSLNKPQTGNPSNWSANISRYREITRDASKPNFEEDLRRCVLRWKSEIA